MLARYQRTSALNGGLVEIVGNQRRHDPPLTPVIISLTRHRMSAIPRLRMVPAPTTIGAGRARPGLSEPAPCRERVRRGCSHPELQVTHDSERRTPRRRNRLKRLFARLPQAHRPRSAIGAGLGAQAHQLQWMLTTPDVIGQRAWGRALHVTHDLLQYSLDGVPHRGYDRMGFASALCQWRHVRHGTPRGAGAVAWATVA
jgi:hypothetical protein